MRTKSFFLTLALKKLPSWWIWATPESTKNPHQHLAKGSKLLVCIFMHLTWWKKSFKGRGPLLEDELWWKMTFYGKWPLMEDNLLWKTTFYGSWHCNVHFAFRTLPLILKIPFSTQINFRFAYEIWRSIPEIITLQCFSN